MVTLLLDSSALAAYARRELPAGLAAGELMAEVAASGGRSGTSALALVWALQEVRRDASAGKVLADLASSGDALLVLPFTDDDAFAAVDSPRSGLPLWHVARLAKRSEAMVATALPAAYVDLPVELLDLSEPF